MPFVQSDLRLAVSDDVDEDESLLVDSGVPLFDLCVVARVHIGSM